MDLRPGGTAWSTSRRTGPTCGRAALRAPWIPDDGGMSTVETVERALCEIFAEVLELDEMDPDDGFFDVGGDSVLAVQVVQTARAAGLRLSGPRLFDPP